MTFSRARRMALSLSLVALSAPLWAQQTGTITGKVTDTSGGVLPGVSVEARSNVLPGPRTTVTGGNGDYRLPALPPGEYTLVFSLSGMQSANRKAFVQLAQETALDAKLGVQGLTEAVTVTAAAATSFIDKDSAAVATGLSSAQLRGLPLGTEYRDLIKVIPGIQYSQETTRGPSVGGSGQDNVYKFDGVNVTLPLFGTLAAEPSSHDIAQITVIKSGARAIDFDRAGGFSIDSVSKSGSDKFTGEVDYRLQNSNMSSDLKSGSASRYEQDKAWVTAGLGGPLVKDHLYFYGSYYRPTIDRANRANLYGSLPAYNSTRNEGFGKLTFTPTSKILLNASYRQSKRLETGASFASNASSTTGTGYESHQKIFTADGSWVINPRSYATFKFTKFENPTQGRPDNVANVTIGTSVGTKLDLANLDKSGLFSVPAPIAGQTAYNGFIQPLIDRYGYSANGAKVGGGTVGYGSQFDNDDFFRDAGQVGYNLTVGNSVKHDLHAGFQMYTDSEDLLRSSNGWGVVSSPGGRTSFQGRPIYYLAEVQQQTTGAVLPIHSEYKSQSIELNDTIHYKDWTFNLGVLASKDELYGQGMKNDASTLSGFTLSPGTKYKMYELPFKKMIQPRLSTTWAYNGKDTIYGGYAQYKPAASSLPRAASWARNLAATIREYFDETGTLFAVDPILSSSGKLFVNDLTPRTTDEFLLGTARQLNSHLTARVYGQYRKGSHFWEDTNNDARLLYNPPASVNGVSVARDLYIPNLTAQRTQIGSGTPNGSTYVIAELDGAYTKYWEGTLELEWHGAKGMANFSYTRSHYYGNFDQDNTTGAVNDMNTFIGSSNLADGAGRQLWDFKDGTLRGDRPHMLKVSGFRSLKWNAQVGAFFVFQSGQPWESMSYEPYRALTTSTSDSNRYAEPAGSRRTDSHYQLDLNYTQNINLTSRFKMQLVANLFNVFDKQTGYNIQPSVHVPVTTTTTTDGKSVTSGFGIPRSYYDPRRIEIDARIRF